MRVTCGGDCQSATLARFTSLLLESSVAGSHDVWSVVSSHPAARVLDHWPCGTIYHGTLTSSGPFNSKLLASLLLNLHCRSMPLQIDRQRLGPSRQSIVQGVVLTATESRLCILVKASVTQRLLASDAVTQLLLASDAISIGIFSAFLRLSTRR